MMLRLLLLHYWKCELHTMCGGSGGGRSAYISPSFPSSQLSCLQQWPLLWWSPGRQSSECCVCSSHLALPGHPGGAGLCLYVHRIEHLDVVQAVMLLSIPNSLISWAAKAHPATQECLYSSRGDAEGAGECPSCLPSL